MINVRTEIVMLPEQSNTDRGKKIIITVRIPKEIFSSRTEWSSEDKGKVVKILQEQRPRGSSVTPMVLERGSINRPQRLVWHPFKFILPPLGRVRQRHVSIARKLPSVIRFACEQADPVSMDVSMQLLLLPRRSFINMQLMRCSSSDSPGAIGTDTISLTGQKCNSNLPGPTLFASLIFTFTYLQISVAKYFWPLFHIFFQRLSPD